jgi:hypothetical protein
MHFVSPGWFAARNPTLIATDSSFLEFLCSKSDAPRPAFSSASCVLRPSLHRWLCGPLRASLASSTFSLHNVLCFADLYGRSSNWILQGSEMLDQWTDQREEIPDTFFSGCTTGNNFSIPRGKKMSTAISLTNRNQQKNEKNTRVGTFALNLLFHRILVTAEN